MRNFTLLFLAVLLPLWGNAQSFSVYKRDTINRTDVNGKRQGNWIIFGFMKKNPQYKDSSIMELGKYTDSKKTGTWLEFYPSGIKKSSIEFVNNRPDGHCTMYFENGGVSEEGTWKGNRWTGTYRSYDQKCGSVMIELEMSGAMQPNSRKTYQYDNRCRKIFMVQSAGDTAWKAETYDSTGRVIRTQQGRRGTEPEYPVRAVSNTAPAKREGYQSYPTDGKVMIEGNWTNDSDTTKNKAGSPHYDDGQQTLLNSKNLISMKGYFVHYQLKDGLQYIYDSNDKLIQIKQYKDYKYVGDLALDKAR